MQYSSYHQPTPHLLIDSNAKRKQFLLDNLFVRDGLGRVEDNQNQVAGARRGNDLATATATIRGSFDDSREIQHLNPRTTIFHGSGNARQGGKLVRGGFTPRSRQRREKGRFYVLQKEGRGVVRGKCKSQRTNKSTSVGIHRRQ